MKTIIITYTSSGGVTFNFKAAPIRIKAANFHNYSWRRETVALQYGERVVDFSKKAQTYRTTLYLDQDPETLYRLHAEWERDIFLRKPGRITWNGEYIECYVSSSSTYPTAGNVYIANEIEIYCPSPFWTRETRFSFSADDGSGEAYPYLDYSYGYSYDYGKPPSGAALLWGDETGIVAFRAIISGPAVNPTFILAGRTYGATLTLEAGQTLTIDTRSTAPMGEQVFVGSGDAKTNFFHARIGEIEPFIADHNGWLVLPGLYSMDLTVYQGRSEPSWL